jgi:lipoprotein-anchoring transpeptidase ErfK/SrfK
MNCVSALRVSVSTGALLRVALLTAAGVIAAATPADAAVYYWRESDPGFYGYALPPLPPPPRRVHRAPKKQDTKLKETTVHPQAPLVIAVSIGTQRVKIYDANGFFAEAPVSTGMPGHPTPMGVFSVIEKDRYHHSNIYSGAPMPFMQRITWGGVALHAGVLPGHPASHGCIRMPNDFAIKMWGWTKLGARVFVTPGELPAPISFSHPLLAAYKVAPQPVVVEPPSDLNAKVGPKADLGAAEVKPVEANLDLRPSVGHDKSAEAPTTRTADAGSKTKVTMSDAPSGGATPARKETKVETARADTAKSDGATSKTIETADAAGSVPAAGTTGEAKRIAKSAEVNIADAKPSETAAARADGDDARPERTASADVKTEDKPEAKADDVKPEAPSAAEAPKALEPSTPGGAKVDAPKTVEAPKAAETPTSGARPDAANADAAKPAEKAVDTVKTTTDDAKPEKKDETRINPPAKMAKEPPKRTGQIAVFISGKDSKLYVRQGFQPLFDAPVTIASSDRPLGMHVFTAQVDKADTNVLHWSVVTVPMSSRALRGEERRERVVSHKHKGKGAPPPPVEAKPLVVPDNPAEALDRITVSPEVMTRIAEALNSGGSIIVADQSIKQGETGEYTDFILSLR